MQSCCAFVMFINFCTFTKLAALPYSTTTKPAAQQTITGYLLYLEGLLFLNVSECF